MSDPTPMELPPHFYNIHGQLLPEKYRFSPEDEARLDAHDFYSHKDDDVSLLPYKGNEADRFMAWRYYGQFMVPCTEERLGAMAWRIFREREAMEYLRREAALQAWKQSQLEVEASWDDQAVGKELGVQLGQPIRPAILPGIIKLKQQVATLEDFWDSALSESVGIRYNYDTKIVTNERAESAEQQVAELQVKLEDAGKVLGAVCVAGTIITGEKILPDIQHAAIDAIQSQIDRAESAEAKLAKAAGQEDVTSSTAANPLRSK